MRSGEKGSGRRVAIIGAGLSGLSIAARLAKAGFEVTVHEKHREPGGVARTVKDKGFTFDMGPTWYLMPEVFARFFRSVGRDIRDYLDLAELEPSYKVFFENDPPATIHRDFERNAALFDSFEPEGGEKLARYLAESKFKYEAALQHFLYRDYRSPFDFMRGPIIRKGLRLHLLKGLDAHASRFFDDHRSKKIVEFNTVFLGSSPFKTPALYSLMAHVDLTIGVYYPMGGIHELPKAIHRVAEEHGAVFRFDDEARRIVTRRDRAVGVETDSGFHEADIVLSSIDYRHADAVLLGKGRRNYPEIFWSTRTMAISTLLIYLGLDVKLPGLVHHSFYLADDWKEHFDDIFESRRWPRNPCYYVGCPSKTDPSVAPEGMENLFILVPLAPGLDDTDEAREALADRIIGHLERTIGADIKSHVVCRHLMSHRDFSRNNNYFRGTALGLAHTLDQTAILRPSHVNFRIPNMYYSGHYTQPGIGMPMAMIGSHIVSKLIIGRHGQRERTERA